MDYRRQGMSRPTTQDIVNELKRGYGHGDGITQDELHEFIETAFDLVPGLYHDAIDMAVELAFPNASMESVTTADGEHIWVWGSLYMKGDY